MKFTKVNNKTRLAAAKLVSDGADFELIAESLAHVKNPTSDINKAHIEFIELCKCIKDICLSEKGWMLKHRSNTSVTYVMKDWLLGLPSILDLPFTYHDIEQWQRNEGIISSDATPAKVAKTVDQYWEYIADTIVMHANKELR